MQVTINTTQGTVSLQIPAPDGLTRRQSPASEYVIKFISPEVATALYDALVNYPTPKTTYMVDRMVKGEVYEVPFFDQISETGGEITNDAHVLRALCLLGVQSIPVVVHQDAARLVK